MPNQGQRCHRWTSYEVRAVRELAALGMPDPSIAMAINYFMEVEDPQLDARRVKALRVRYDIPAGQPKRGAGGHGNIRPGGTV